MNTQGLPARGGHRGRARATSTVAAIGGILIGCEIGAIGGALLFLGDEPGTATHLRQTLVAAPFLGAAAGAAVSRPLSHHFGNRRALLLTAPLCLAGVLAAAFAPMAPMLIAAHVTVGLAIGCTALVLPRHLADLSPPEQRTRSLKRHQPAFCAGVLAGAALVHLLSGHHAWRFASAAAALPALLVTLGVLRLPESPAWLAGHGREREARSVLVRLRGDADEADDELRRIIHEHEQAAPSWRNALQTAGPPTVLLAVTVAVAQHTTGIAVVLGYGPTLLRETGLDAHAATLGAVALAAALLLAALLCARLLDRIGRRTLMLWSTGGTVAALAALSVAFTVDLTMYGVSRPQAVLGALMFHAAWFTLGLGPLVRVVTGEMLPRESRERLLPPIAATGWFAAFLVTLTFPPLLDRLGAAGVFRMYCAIGVCAFGYLLRALPETRGLTPRDITGRISPTHAGEPAWKTGEKAGSVQHVSGV